jgi:hypothetical protein
MNVDAVVLTFADADFGKEAQKPSNKTLLNIS